jgi:hypothetical protein
VQAELDAATADLNRVRHQQQQRVVYQRSLGGLLGRLLGFIGPLPPTTPVEMLPPVQPELQPGESVPAALMRVRKEFLMAQSELSAIRAAPLATADVKRMATEAVKKFAAPSLNFDGGELRIVWPKDPVAFLAWVEQERVVSGLHKQIDALPTSVDALSAAEKEERTPLDRDKRPRC